jgi:hypothetical protein
MDTLLIIGDGSILKGIIISVLSINGLYLMFRGFASNLDHLEDKPHINKSWKASLYFVLIILSYIAVFYAASKLL